MVKKQFFRTRTPAQIKALNVQTVYTSNDLVKRIDDLDPDSDAIELRTRILPNRVYSKIITNKKTNEKRRMTMAECSRWFRRHGSYIMLNVPKTLKKAIHSKKIPLDYRTEVFNKLHKKMRVRAKTDRLKEKDIYAMGIGWRVDFGDKEVRLQPFDVPLRAAKRMTYSENIGYPMKVETYPDAKSVKEEGASVIVYIPAEEQKSSSYRSGLIHVPWVPRNPVDKKNHNLASILQLKPKLEIFNETDYVKKRLPHDDYNITCSVSGARGSPDQITFSVLDVAVYLGILKKQLTEEHNQTGLTYNPFTLPSQHGAEFYSKLINNMLIFDPTLKNPKENKTGGLRKLHIEEQSILYCRGIIVFGPNDFPYWDPTRDGIYKNYDWKNPIEFEK